MKQLTPRPQSDKQQLARAGQALRPTPPPVRHDKASLLPAGRRMEAAPRPVRSGPPLRTRFVINLESNVRYNLDELVLYEKCIHQTLAYRGRDGYRNSQDQDLHIRTTDVTTWNPGEVLAPMLKPLMHHFQNLWDEFADGEGPKTAPSLVSTPLLTT
ncbi:hypothetical protein [Hymenobacter cellulosilyticus]|uniref:Uncharacterized protein n=1 Tax=Hymenobacter cellulosilyticus TaxID=2932248 RepID=A0A8T9Q6K7_9BACT|nr:hypothetical protein [Hymenobacter cellulosilyticus]UOQ73197.1 hypothetical protein MUN79_04290 [Hymenobacter cellulosilyticus]